MKQINSNSWLFLVKKEKKMKKSVLLTLTAATAMTVAVSPLTAQAADRHAKFTKIGVGYYQDVNGTNYWNQLYTY